MIVEVVVAVVTMTAAMTAVYEYNSEVNTQIPEIELDVTAQTLTAEARKLRAKWSPEAIQDLKNDHGVEGETLFISEIANALSDVMLLSPSNSCSRTIFVFKAFIISIHPRS